MSPPPPSRPMYSTPAMHWGSGGGSIEKGERGGDSGSPPYVGGGASAVGFELVDSSPRDAVSSNHEQIIRLTPDAETQNSEGGSSSTPLTQRRLKVTLRASSGKQKQKKRTVKTAQEERQEQTEREVASRFFNCKILQEPSVLTGGKRNKRVSKAEKESNKQKILFENQQHAAQFRQFFDPVVVSVSQSVVATPAEVGQHSGVTSDDSPISRSPGSSRIADRQEQYRQRRIDWRQLLVIRRRRQRLGVGVSFRVSVRMMLRRLACNERNRS